MTLMEMVQLVVTRYAFFSEEFQRLLETQAKRPSSELNSAIGLFAEILNNQKIETMLACAEVVRGNYRECTMQATFSTIHVTAVIDNIFCSLS